MINAGIKIVLDRGSMVRLSFTEYTARQSSKWQPDLPENGCVVELCLPECRLGRR